MNKNKQTRHTGSPGSMRHCHMTLPHPHLPQPSGSLPPPAIQRSQKSAAASPGQIPRRADETFISEMKALPHKTHTSHIARLGSLAIGRLCQLEVGRGRAGGLRGRGGGGNITVTNERRFEKKFNLSQSRVPLLIPKFIFFNLPKSRIPSTPSLLPNRDLLAVSPPTSRS